MQVTLKNWLSAPAAVRASDAPLEEEDCGSQMQPLPTPLPVEGCGNGTSQLSELRDRAASSSQASTPRPAQKQPRTLHSFFRPRSTGEAQPRAASAAPRSDLASQSDQKPAMPALAIDPDTSETPSTRSPDSAFLEAEAAAAEAQRRAALSEAKSAWSRIHTKMGAPRCRHGEQAALKRTNKSGENKGRFDYIKKACLHSRTLDPVHAVCDCGCASSHIAPCPCCPGRWFYTCARPAGPAPHGDCGFFQWVERRPSDRGPTAAKRQKPS